MTPRSGRRWLESEHGADVVHYADVLASGTGALHATRAFYLQAPDTWLPVVVVSAGGRKGGIGDSSSSTFMKICADSVMQDASATTPIEPHATQVPVENARIRPR